MRFWDSSAIVPLLVTQSTTRRLQALVANDPDMLVWWGAGVECVSALARLERDRVANAQSLLAGLGRLREYATRWHEVDPIDAVRDAAVRFLRVHPLRAADALQLAAAYVGAERRPTSLEFVTLDEALAVAAGKEGFALTSIGPVD